MPPYAAKLCWVLIGAASITTMSIEAATAQGEPARPMFATTKVEGTDNVYVYRYGNHQAMFVTTPAGVIATDPIGYGRPQAVKTYLDEIRKVSKQPVRYVVYSHHHFDHIAGGKPFKDAGARFIAHRNATARLRALRDPHTVLPDESIGNRRDIKLGGTTLELHYLGVNHSDSSIVMRLPKERVLFAVDWVSAGTFPGRGMIDSQPLLWVASLKRLQKLQFDRFIPGHPGPGGRLGTRNDIPDLITLLDHASSTVQTAARAGKCWDAAEKEVTLPKYEKMPGYNNGLRFVITRYCGLWGRGT
jgi:glyoxylase-like metal-dependent hydrolase (beta-lactamase superfamily II)